MPLLHYCLTYVEELSDYLTVVNNCEVFINRNFLLSEFGGWKTNLHSLLLYTVNPQIWVRYLKYS